MDHKKKPYIKLINRLMKDFSNPTSVCTYFEKQLYWHVARHLLVGYWLFRSAWIALLTSANQSAPSSNPFSTQPKRIWKDVNYIMAFSAWNPSIASHCIEIEPELLRLHCFFWSCNSTPHPPLQVPLAADCPRSAFQAEPSIHAHTSRLISSLLFALVIDFVRRAFTVFPLLLLLLKVSASISPLLRSPLWLTCLNYPASHFIAGPITSSAALSESVITLHIHPPIHLSIHPEHALSAEFKSWELAWFEYPGPRKVRVCNSYSIKACWRNKWKLKRKLTSQHIALLYIWAFPPFAKIQTDFFVKNT